MRRRTISPIVVTICSGCGSSITDDEHHYYGQCEDCARRDWRRLQRWKSGADDAALDHLSAGSKRVVH